MNVNVRFMPWLAWVYATKLLAVLSSGIPKSRKQIVDETGLDDVVGVGLWRLWKGGYILRTKKPLKERSKIFKGRAGVSGNLRSYHLYVLRPASKDLLMVQGLEFVRYEKKHLDRRGYGESKAKLILRFLKENGDRAFYSKEIVEALKDKGVKPCDVMTHVRRFERKGLVYVRGYRTHDRQTPFKEGYLD